MMGFYGSIGFSLGICTLQTEVIGSCGVTAYLTMDLMGRGSLEITSIIV